MNKRLIAERFTKAIATYPQEANVQRQIADKMIHLLTEHLPSPCPESDRVRLRHGNLFPYVVSDSSSGNALIERPLPGDEILLRGFAKERASVLPAGRCGNSALSCRKYPDNFLFRLAMVRISRKLFQEM